MINLVQQLMDAHPDDWTAYLEAVLNIGIVRNGDLASLKYDQIKSPMDHPMVQQCRGMVVDCRARTVLAWPYNKFWNLGEGRADHIDWATARVQEKLDGSLMILYWNRIGWCVASSGHPTAGGSFGTSAETFGDAFWRIADSGAVCIRDANAELTYMFELCDQPNQVVVRHERPRLVLHGARNLMTGKELSAEELADEAERLRCELVREFPIRSAEEALAAAEALNPGRIEQEGFVVVDAEHRRVKIKSPRYVLLHHMRGDTTPRRAVELWQTGESSELLSHFPEMSDAILPIHHDLDGIAACAVQDFLDNMPRASRKEFALAVKDKPWAAVLFRMLDFENPTIEDAKAIMRNLSASALERMVIGPGPQ